MRSYGLSKSRIMSGLQCAKRLYLEVHHPELAEKSADKEALFAVGRQVGELAQTLYPGGTLIDHADDLKGALQETETLLSASGDALLFEAALQHDGVLFRADILAKESNSIRLIEVKSSTKAKDEHYQDCAIQAWVLRNAGYPVDGVELAHLDNTFVYDGNGDYTGLFTHVDLTGEVRALELDVPDWVARSKEILAASVPEVEVGSHCKKPYDCPFMSHCLSEGPEYPLIHMPRGGKLVEDLRAEGVKDIREIPEGRLTNRQHERIRRVTIAGQAELDPKASEKLRGLAYPRYYLDFETIGPAIPIWAGTRPYQQLPFQWSCHIEQENTKLLHASFLDTSGEPPMRRLAEHLLATLGHHGPIFMYTDFEKRVMNSLAVMFPDLADRLNQMMDRLVDLCEITRAHYYHPEMKGSWSLKAVLPTVAPELDYGALDEVQEGMAAGRAYFEIMDMKTDPKRRQELIGSLREYCKLDTLALVRLARFLQQK